jgi:hypothetical protein
VYARRFHAGVLICMRPVPVPAEVAGASLNPITC